MIFRVKMDACFEADDIVDAMEKLGTHLITVSNGAESSLLEPPSSIEIGEKSDKRWMEATG